MFKRVGGRGDGLPFSSPRSSRKRWVFPDAFLAGYGAAQRMPGPVFTFAAYVGATIALAAIFLPGLLLLLGALPFWDALAGRGNAQALMHRANAAVFGILGAALYDPVFTLERITPSNPRIKHPEGRISLLICILVKSVFSEP